MIRHGCDIAEDFFETNRWCVCLDRASLVGPNAYHVWVLCQWVDDAWEPTLDALPIDYCPWCGERLAQILSQDLGQPPDVA